MKGRVKWWSKDAGYGFVEHNESENAFVHLEERDKEYPIFENQEIEFTIEEKNNNFYLRILKNLKN